MGIGGFEMRRGKFLWIRRKDRGDQKREGWRARKGGRS